MQVRLPLWREPLNVLIYVQKRYRRGIYKGRIKGSMKSNSTSILIKGRRRLWADRNVQGGTGRTELIAVVFPVCHQQCNRPYTVSISNLSTQINRHPSLVTQIYPAIPTYQRFQIAFWYFFAHTLLAVGSSSIFCPEAPKKDFSLHDLAIIFGSIW